MSNYIFDFVLYLMQLPKLEKCDCSSEESEVPSYYKLKIHALGYPFISTIRQALLDNTTTHVKASKLMDISPMEIGILLEHST
ncbi:MAG: hypothetical protein PUN43_05590 [Candidatus Liberibacter asiaticus]|nr:hypothetical protein [Candidatus Liberibacter asiaticus]